MEHVSAEVHRAVDNIAQIVRRDGGVLELRTFDPEAGELVVTFGQAASDDCVACTIDEPMVRAFLEEAVRAQGVALTALHIQPPVG
jgi:Fe-S cluster biogenesis protein NfuA